MEYHTLYFSLLHCKHKQRFLGRKVLLNKNREHWLARDLRKMHQFYALFTHTLGLSLEEKPFIHPYTNRKHLPLQQMTGNS